MPGYTPGYIDEAYVRLMLTDEKVVAMAGDTPRIEALIEAAEGDTHAKLTLGGYRYYSPAYALEQHGGDIYQVPIMVRNAAVGAFVDAMYGPTDRELPRAFLRFVTAGADIASGELVIPGLTRSTSEGPAASTASSSSTDTRPKSVMSNLDSY